MRDKEIVLDKIRLYESKNQGTILYNTAHISGVEVKEFDIICKNIHKDINEPHKLYRLVKHCERVRSNGPWENLDAIIKAENMKPRRDIVNKGIATGWIVTTKKQRLGHGRKRGNHTIYILSHPSNYVDDIVMSCKYNDKATLAKHLIELDNKNDILTRKRVNHE